MITSLYIDDLQIHLTATSALLSFKGLGSPLPRTVIRERGQRHGVVNQTEFYGARMFELRAGVWGPGLAMWQEFDAIKAKLQLGAVRTLRFRREGFTEDEQASVIVASEVDEDATGARVIWSVTLLAEDPRIFAATLKAFSYDPTAVLTGGGAPIPMVLPLVFATNTVTHLQAVNLGQASTPPVLTIRGPIVNPIVDNDTLTQSIFLTYALGENDTIVVDVAARSVKLNGAERKDLLQAKQTRWFELAKGTNLLRLRGTAMVATKTQLTCQYREARI